MNSNDFDSNSARAQGAQGAGQGEQGKLKRARESSSREGPGIGVNFFCLLIYINIHVSFCHDQYVLHSINIVHVYIRVRMGFFVKYAWS
jgi:hypothetical protein